MSTFEDSLSDADRLAGFLMRYNPKPYNPRGYDDARRLLYAFMLLGMLWFENGIPEDPKSKLVYYLNPQWPHLIIPYDVEKRVLRLELIDLEFIWDKLKKPKWVSSRNPLHGEVSLVEVYEKWPKY